MKGSLTTFKIGGIFTVTILGLLLVLLVLGVIDTEQLKSTFLKAVLVIGVVVLSFVAVMAIASDSSDK